MNKIKLSIVYDDNPICRGYIQLIRSINYELDYIFQLNSSIFFKKIKFLTNKYNKNYYALKMLENRNVLNSIEQLENFFNVKKNFIHAMYNLNFDNLKFKKIINITDKSINSEKLVFNHYFNNAEIILNTGKQILKNKKLFTKKFIHIHPAKLPNIKGADGSFWEMLTLNSLSSTLFEMNEKIDEGKIIFINSYNLSNLKIKDFGLSDIDKYKFWYSFIDPLIRVDNLKKFLLNSFCIYKNKIASKSEYFSFMDNEKRKAILDKIFI
jgi:hypothetical protein